MKKLTKIAFGGGCHWCTEAVFQSLIGVEKVEQGFVASTDENNSFSEAVIVHFNAEFMTLKTLIEVHLHTHKSTSNHSMRKKYRSAIYTFDEDQKLEAFNVLNAFKKEFSKEIITRILSFKDFKPSSEQFTNYYLKNPNKPFCKTFINPKLMLLLRQFSDYMNNQKVEYLKQVL